MIFADILDPCVHEKYTFMANSTICKVQAVILTKRHNKAKKVEIFFLKIALHLIHSNCFYQKMILHFYISSCKGRATSKTTTDELGIKVPLS